MELMYSIAVFCLILFNIVVARNEVALCCAFRGSPGYDEFSDCILQNTDFVSSNNSILLVTHATKAIMSYAVHSMMINSMFASQSGYSFLAVTGKHRFEVHESDPRWNKVIIAINILEMELSKMEDLRLRGLIVMDVDTAVVNWQFDIHALLHMFPKAHILMSADKFDSANTGVMIIRCSKWSLEFLRTWWVMRYDFASDQQALSTLLATIQGTKKSRERIMILPVDAVNTPYPVHSANISSLSVLHIMGEPNEVRKTILRRAVDSLCAMVRERTADEQKHINLQSIAPLHLGISQAFVVFTIAKYRLDDMELSLLKCDDFLDSHSDTSSNTLVSAEDVTSLLQSAHAKITHFCTLLAPLQVMELHFCKGNGSHSVVAADGSFESGKCNYILNPSTADNSSNTPNHSINITDKCISSLDRMVVICQKFVAMFPDWRPLLLEQLVKSLYDSFLMGDDTVETLQTGQRALSVLHRLSTLPSTKNFFRPEDLLFKESVINRGLAKLAGRVGDMEGACHYGENSFMNIVETLKLSTLGHVDFISYLRQYVKCSILMMDCLVRFGKVDVATQLGKDASEMVEGIFKSSSEESNQLGSLLVDLYLQRLEVNAVRIGIGSDGSDGEYRQSQFEVVKSIKLLLRTNTIELSIPQQNIWAKYAT